jgi:two-component system sensor histidine kinase/response regulator
VSAPAGVPPLLLVVDDNPMNVDPLCDLLQAMGYRVAQALDGPTALEIVRERFPDLILLDIMMPGMNGYEVCRRLKADPRFAKIPIVFVTALSDTEDKLQAIEAGGDDFLTKPFNRPILLARIRSLLRLKEANDDLEASYLKLQALERLKDDLMKMVVHDLKSPLSAILATLEMAVDGDLGPLTPEQHRLLADAHLRGDDLVRLIDDLFELTALEESRVTPDLSILDVGDLLHDIASGWRVRLERSDATLHVEEVPQLRICADEHLLRRVLSNLIGNAIRHGGPNLHIRLSAVRAPAGETGTETGVRITVADDGVGIPEAYQELIFRKFGSVRRDGLRSSGLGLTFCKLAVEAHGGQIWVESRDGEGSAFHFIIPARPPRASLSHHGEPAAVLPEVSGSTPLDNAHDDLQTAGETRAVRAENA